MDLPKTKRRISDELNTQSILLYGPPGVGKTTFASRFEDALFIATQDGQRSIEAFVEDVRNWKQFQEVVVALEGKQGKRYKTIVVDFIDLLYDFCMDYCGKKHGFDHPGDEGYGKGWKIVRTQFATWITRLCTLKKGIIFISHADDKEVKTRVMNLTKTMPTMSKQARDVILPMVSIIIYAGFRFVKNKETGEKEERRVAIFKPSENIEAKDRTGRLPEKGVMPLSAPKFIAAYKAGRKQ